MPAIRIAEFDTWRPGYGLAVVQVVVAGTNTPASIYSDEALTVAVPNPQTLSERTLGGISYGKFAAPRYVGVPYELIINSVDRSGIQRLPLTTLDEQDASEALVTAAGGTVANTLEDHLARSIDVRDYGIFMAVGEPGASAATNTATIVSAIGAAASGGYVEIPAGTYQVTAFTIPQGVVLRGRGRVVTTLQSVIADDVVTIGGARAGLSRITIDGNTLVVGSVGLFASNKDQIVIDDVEIKRFETGAYLKGGEGALWRELYISNCVNGLKAHGDDNSGQGGPLSFNTWNGGKIELCSTFGVELKNVDALCEHFRFKNIGFDSNTGDAVRVTGARNSSFFDCWWSNNTSDLVVADGTPVADDNTVIGLTFDGGSIDGGTITLKDTLEAVAFRRLDLKDITITLTTPKANVLAEDCREISGVTIAGTTPTAWTRHKTGDRGSTTGITTGSTPTKAWSISLDHGQRVYLEAKVIGRQRNGTDVAFYHIAVSAGRPGATLAYDTQTANFTVGNILTGQTSGATARITADSDSGAVGTLTLQDVVGTFVDNEIITDGSGGSATTNGTISTSTAALAGTVSALRAAQETDASWDATFGANGPEIQVSVTGAASKTVEWTVDVDVVSS
jgi:hypothetical protein